MKSKSPEDTAACLKRLLRKDEYAARVLCSSSIWTIEFQGAGLENVHHLAEIATMKLTQSMVGT